MHELKPASWKKEWTFTPSPFALFVHTPLCGTCKAARRMLEIALEIVPDFNIVEANINMLPELAQKLQIESVPCILIKRRNGTIYKQYRFTSVTDIVERLRIESEQS